MCDLQDLQALKQPLFGYVLRFTLDSAAGTWQIFAKPIDDGPARLFSNLEALFAFLERRIANEGQAKGEGFAGLYPHPPKSLSLSSKSHATFI